MARAVAWINLSVATFLAASGLWIIHVANEAATEAERIYGRNVDSGAILYFFVVIYFAPNAAFFGIAALAMFRRWRVWWLAQTLAVAWLVGSVLIIVFEREIRAL